MVLAAVGVGGMAVAERHMVVVPGIDRRVAHPKQPSALPGK